MKNERLHLLVVEDEAAHMEAIRRAFDQAGAKADIQVAGTLREYRELIAAQPPDLALVDLNLPDGRATDVLTQPAEDALFPILVMTAFGNELIAVEMMKSGALDYVVKSPEAFAALPQTVARALREWRLLQKQKQAVAELQRQDANLRAQNDELTRFNRVAVGRELRMIELKHEINELCGQLGEPPRHKIMADPAATPGREVET